MSSIEEFIEGRPSAPNAFLAEGNENLPSRGCVKIMNQPEGKKICFFRL